MSAPAFTASRGEQFTLERVKRLVLSTKLVTWDHPELDDIVQEVALKLWRAPTYPAPTVAKTAVIDYLRSHGNYTRQGNEKKTKPHVLSLDIVTGEKNDVAIVDTVASTDQAIEDMDWDSDGAKKLLDKLSPHERYIVLGLANGVPMSRIALDLTVSASRASQILDTARRRLAGELPPSVRSKLRERPQPHWGRDWDSPARRRKEIRILQMNADGHTKQEMAAELGCTDRSVTQYMQCAIRRMGARNKTQAVAEAMRRGLIK